ncbi:MAG: transglycosylase SLT domain-containing protein [Caulobacterales bacterium]|nr:transglycosylase SLT domain-containing protein [Caulobacterales bacterium]
MSPNERIEAAIANAANVTGVSPTLLRAMAAQESSFDPKARASTSSAAGLYQFIEETWLRTLAAHGHEHGFAYEAQQISYAKDGRLQVDDPAAREELLSLRLDPEAAALMAGVLATENAAKLEAHLGRPPRAGEMYMAHVLGANGAARLLEAVAEDPTMSAPALFPEAARANRGLFYDRQGEARDVAGLAQRLAESVDPGWTPSAGAPAPAGEAGQILHSPVLQAALEGRSLAPRVIARPPTTVPGAAPPLLLSSALVEALASLEPPETGNAEARERERTSRTR